jgi:hypothetical protein
MQKDEEEGLPDSVPQARQSRADPPGSVEVGLSDDELVQRGDSLFLATFFDASE